MSFDFAQDEGRGGEISNRKGRPPLILSEVEGNGPSLGPDAILSQAQSVAPAASARCRAVLTTHARAALYEGAYPKGRGWHDAKALRNRRHPRLRECRADDRRDGTQ